MWKVLFRRAVIYDVEHQCRRGAEPIAEWPWPTYIRSSRYFELARFRPWQWQSSSLGLSLVLDCKIADAIFCKLRWKSEGAWRPMQGVGPLTVLILCMVLL